MIFTLQTYLLFLLLTLLAIFFLFSGGVYLIFRRLHSPKRKLKLNKACTIQKSAISPSPVHTRPKFDVSAIAGEDLVGTKLDLARAYIETGKKKLAKHILLDVVTQGSATQQSEARTLLDLT